MAGPGFHRLPSSVGPPYSEHSGRGSGGSCESLFVLLQPGSSASSVGLGKVFMRRLKPSRVWALILMLFVLCGPGAMMLRPVVAFSYGGSGGELFEPESGGGGSYGDPDDPQNKPKLVPGGDPEYTVINPIGLGAGHGTYPGLGRWNGSLWMWRLRVLIVGVRYHYLRI